jgi:hypothetical protein
MCRRRTIDTDERARKPIPTGARSYSTPALAFIWLARTRSGHRDAHGLGYLARVERCRRTCSGCFRRLRKACALMTGYPYYDGSSMRATQVPSNQDSGASGNLVSEVTKILASVDRSRLSYVVKQLKRLRASDASPRAIKSQRQRARRPGWVIDAVVRVLANEGRPMRSTHVRAAIESLLGHSVSKDSVDSCLSKGARGKQPRFERVSYGCYRLIRST